MAKKIQITEPKTKKHFTSSKTIIVSLVLVVLGALETFDFTAIVPEGKSGLIVAGIGIVMAVLRKMTKSAI